MQLPLFPALDLTPHDVAFERDRDEQIRMKVEADLDYGPERDEPDFPEDE